MLYTYDMTGVNITGWAVGNGAKDKIDHITQGQCEAQTNYPFLNDGCVRLYNEEITEYVSVYYFGFYSHYLGSSVDILNLNGTNPNRDEKIIFEFDWMVKDAYFDTVAGVDFEVSVYVNATDSYTLTCFDQYQDYNFTTNVWNKGFVCYIDDSLDINYANLYFKVTMEDDALYNVDGLYFSNFKVYYGSEPDLPDFNMTGSIAAIMDLLVLSLLMNFVTGTMKG